MAESEIPQPIASGATDHPDPNQAPVAAPPLPEGATSQPPSAPPLPEGASYDKPASTESGQPSTLDKIGQVAGDVGIGFGKGIESTTEGIGSLIHKIPGIGPKIIPATGLTAEGLQATPQGTAQWVGYAGENLAEFMLGDEALKGLSMADKFKQISGVMGILEKSPRLMRAIQTGVDVGKAASELGPAEQEAIKNSPILSRLVSAGMDAIRQGTVQGAQTAVKTGGDIEKAAEEGATTGVASGVLGGAFGMLGRAAEKAGEAGKAVQAAGEAAKAAPSKLEIGEGLANQINDAETKMHGDFEAGIQNLKGKLGDAKVEFQGSPLQKAAQEALQGKTEAKGVLGGGLQKISGGTNDSKNLLTDWADPEKTGDLKIDDLISARQQLGEKIGQLSGGNMTGAERADRAIYQTLRSGIDDTIDSLSKQSGSPEASQDYSALRNAYKEKVNLFKDPAIQALSDPGVDSATKLDNATKYILAGGKTVNKIGNIEKVIGPDATKQLGQHMVSSIMADSTSQSGQLNPVQFAKKWKQIDALPPAAKAKLFDTTGAAKGLETLATDLKSAANYQKLARTGLVLNPLGGPGLAIGMLASGDTASARELLDKVANNPGMWKMFEGAGNVAKKAAASPVAQAAKTAAVKGTGSALNSILQGASEPLSSPIQQDQGVYTNQ